MEGVLELNICHTDGILVVREIHKYLLTSL